MSIFSHCFIKFMFPPMMIIGLLLGEFLTPVTQPHTPSTTIFPTIQDINKDFDGPVGWDTGYAGEMMDFALAILQKKKPDATAREALEDLSS